MHRDPAVEAELRRRAPTGCGPRRSDSMTKPGDHLKEPIERKGPKAVPKRQDMETWILERGGADGPNDRLVLTRMLAGKEVERIELTLEDLVNRVRRRRAAVAVMLPERAWQAQPYGIGIATEGEPGYLPWKGLTRMAFGTYEEASQEAAMINAEVFRLTPQDAFHIVASSMRNGVDRTVTP
jgi:hypothetical protein